MFLNFINDIEIGGDHTDEDSFYHFICIQRYNEILKFKITINHMDVVDAIEDYIKTEDTYNFRVMCEEHVKLLYKIKPSFFPFVGKYRLENDIKKTNNYFVPEKKPLLEELIDLYNNGVYLDTLNNLNSIKNELKKNNNKTQLLILENLCSKFSLELVEKYNVEALEKTLNHSNNLINKDDLNKMKWILKTSQENEAIFNNLNLNKKIKCVEEEKKLIKMIDELNNND